MVHVGSVGWRRHLHAHLLRCLHMDFRRGIVLVAVEAVRSHQIHKDTASGQLRRVHPPSHLDVYPLEQPIYHPEF